MIALLWLLSSAAVDTCAALAGVPLGTAAKNTPVRVVDLRASDVTANTVTLTWRPAAPVDLKWIQIEHWLPNQNIWSGPSATYVSNDITRYVFGGLRSSNTYRFKVCGFKGDKNGKVTGPHVCTNEVTVTTPRALNASGGLGILPRVPPDFVISAITPATSGFRLCSGLTGLVGRYVSGKFEPSDLASSICASGTISIAQRNPQVDVSRRKLRLIVAHAAYEGFGRDGFGTGISGGNYARTDVFELAFAGNAGLAFQVAFASGRGLKRSPEEASTLANYFGPYPQPLYFAVEYLGSRYVEANCTYQAVPASVACK